MLRQFSPFRQAKQAVVRISLVIVQLFTALGAVSWANTPGTAVARSTERPMVLAPNAGDITGTVFNDTNGNGALDANEAGVPGVTVTAFSSGFSLSTTSSASGVYTLTVAGSDTRIEFSGYTGYQSSPVGANSNTSVRFVASPASAVNFGIFGPTEFCQNNPGILVACFVFGDNVSGSGQNDRTVLSYPYTATGTSTALQVSEALARQVGSVYGVGYQRTSKFVFVSSYTKRLTGYGPGTGAATSDGTGTIYMFKAGTPADGVPFVDLDDLFGAATTGNNPHTGFTLQPGNFDAGAYDDVGRMGIGDIDVSEDDRTLWVVNLANQTLYGLPIALNTTLTPTAPTAGQVSSTAIPNPGCVNGSARPFAVKPFNGLVYVGGVCDAISGTAADLQAYVYAYNPATNTWGTPVLQFPLNYPRNCIDVFPTYPQVCKNTTNGSLADWRPWRDTLDTTFPAGYAEGFTAHPQPMLSDIEFVPSASGPGGDMVLGFRDRFPDQIGFDDPGPANNSPGGYLLSALPGGDVLRAGPNAGGTWTIENNSQSNPPGRFGPSLGAGTGEGPGGGEFYFGEELNGRHDETALGALAFAPQFTNVVATAVDPIRAVTAGTIQLNNADGSQSRAYEVYAPPPAPASTHNFRKANGLGDLELLCDAAPIEIGNRVWLDANSNGVQDPGEAPLANIVVRLTDPLGNAVTATTDSNGEYRFSNAAGTTVVNAVYNLNTGAAGSVTLTPFGSYTLTVDLTQPGLSAYNPAPPNADPSANGTARDSNGVQSGNVVNAPVVLSGPGFNNHTYDFGFINRVVNTAALGNYVWVDANYNGIQDEPVVNGRNGVTVTLRNAADNSVLSTTATINDLFGNPGYYTFTSLSPGNYIVCFTLPVGFNFTRPDQVGTEATDSDANIATGCTVTVPLAAGEVNPNVDAGLYQPAALGNYVWVDAGAAAGTAGDGVQNEPAANGVNGVTVTLRNAADNSVVGTLPTINDPSGNPGYYTFTNLVPGSYIVCFDLPAGYSRTPADQGGNDALDSDANVATGCTLTVTLASGEVNPTLDAGIYQPAALGNYVWLDANRDGVQNEPVANGRNGITVTLRRTSDNSVVNTLVTTNDPSGNPGYYTFTNLAPGSYTVCFALPAGVVFTNPDQGGNDALDSDANVATGCTLTVTLASGEVNPNVDAGLFQALPAIVLKKYTNGFDADNPTGPLLIIGSAVTWTYVMTNIGNVDLFDITLVDNLEGPITCPFTQLAVGGTMTCTQNGIAQAGQYANTGVVTGTSGFDEATKVTSTDPSHYFGSNTPPASLGNYVWVDTNGDGVQNEPAANGVNGVTVVLRNAADNSVVNTLVTTNDPSGNPGYYTFTNLLPGNYIVCFTAPTGYTLTLPGQGGNGALDSDANQASGCTATVTLASGEVNPNVDAGLLPLASLGNYVWLDANRDGVQNEPAANGRNGITVTLRRTSDNAVIGTLLTTNDASGNPGYYTFTNLAPGSYTVCFALPPGASFTDPDLGGNDALDSDANTGTGCTPSITLAAGEANPTLDAGLFIASPAIVLKKYTNGFDADVPTGPGLLVGSTVTWTFIITNTGNVPLQDVVLTDNKIGAITCPKTTLAVGETMTCTANGIATVGQYANTGVVTGTNQLNPAQKVTSTDPSHYFGTTQPLASLGNFVWVDGDRDGQQDAGEPGIPGITVTLRNLTGTVVATATTSVSGFYSFTNLVPGSYSVCFILPPGTTLTGQGSDPTSDIDSNADPLTGCTAVVTLAPGQNNPTIDTGVIVAAPGAPQLIIRKSSVPPTGTIVTNGQLITYTLRVTNTGTTTATNVVVDDPVPTDTTYVAGSAVPALQSGPTPLVWALGSLAPSQTVTVQFTVRVNDTVSETAIINQAGVASTEIPRVPSNRTEHPFFPTDVVLIDFGVKADGNGLRISWKTGSEVDTFGFAIYRSESADGANKVLVTRELIAAKGANNAYTMLDATANKTSRYYYWLQEVERSGRLITYAPATWVPQGAQPVVASVSNVAVAGGVPAAVPASQLGANANARAAVGVAPGNTQDTVNVLTERVVVQPAEPTGPVANAEAGQPVVVPEASAPAQPAQPAHQAAVAAQQQAQVPEVGVAAPEAAAPAVAQAKAGERADLPSYQAKPAQVRAQADAAPANWVGWLLVAAAGLAGLLLVAGGFVAYRAVRRRNV